MNICRIIFSICPSVDVVLVRLQAPIPNLLRITAAAMFFSFACVKSCWRKRIWNRENYTGRAILCSSFRPVPANYTKRHVRHVNGIAIHIVLLWVESGSWDVVISDKEEKINNRCCSPISKQKLIKKRVIAVRHANKPEGLESSSCANFISLFLSLYILCELQMPHPPPPPKEKQQPQQCFVIHTCS